MGRKLEVNWQESASELQKQYVQEKNLERRTRLQALWQLCLGKTIKEVAEMVNVSYRTLQYWVSWYRHGGLQEVLERIKGHGKQGRIAKLNGVNKKL